VTKALIDDIIENFQLEKDSIHGPAHWARVRLNGRMLYEAHGGDWQVIELFAFLHDSQRWDDGCDPDHGPRAAAYAERVCGTLFDISPAQLETLKAACMGHTSGHLTDNLTAQICWDSDRLDLWRVGIEPDPYYLGTEMAKKPETIELCMRRSEGQATHEGRRGYAP
jgi:uncharacterized protein